MNVISLVWMTGNSEDFANWWLKWIFIYRNYSPYHTSLATLAIWFVWTENNAMFIRNWKVYIWQWFQETGNVYDTTLGSKW